jgi:hypothetical protein
VRPDVTAVLPEAAPSGPPAAQLTTTVEIARALERWGSARGWRGPDPYDGLNTARVPRVALRPPLAKRVLTQAVKRSPVNLRPLLGVPDGLSAATLATVITAYARNGFMDGDEARRKLRDCITALGELRCASYAEPCWGYHFDVQTRVFFYPRTTPNTIATAFAGLGLLDAYELADAGDALESAVGAGEFFLRHVPQTRGEAGACFGYLPGDRTPIHNANMLVAALLARLARLTGRTDFARAASAAVEYTVTRQLPDGAWLYGDEPHLAWIDGFHTGYLLDGLLTCIEADIGGERAENAWRRGLHYYAQALIEADGTPRYTPVSRYPIDGQCLAQAIRTLARATVLEPVVAPLFWEVLGFGLKRMAMPDGAFVFQRTRWWTNTIAHPRWVEAPMLAALTYLIAAGRSREHVRDG